VDGREIHLSQKELKAKAGPAKSAPKVREAADGKAIYGETMERV